MEEIKWCFSIKKGLKIVEPNKEIALSYLWESEKTLSKIRDLIEDEDFVWASVRIYYCAYYSLYSFLQRIGIKSENHDCSIKLAKKLINKNFINDIILFRENRVDAQYYLKTGQREKMLEFYSKAREFYLEFKEIVENLDNKIDSYINKIKELKNE